MYFGPDGCADEPRLKAPPFAATRRGGRAYELRRSCAGSGAGAPRLPGSFHFDLDVVDFIDFPAADFPTINAGLTLADALPCVKVFTHQPKFAALTICEFNPDHVDEPRLLVRQFVEGHVAAVPGA